MVIEECRQNIAASLVANLVVFLSLIRMSFFLDGLGQSIQTWVVHHNQVFGAWLLTKIYDGVFANAMDQSVVLADIVCHNQTGIDEQGLSSRESDF